MKARNRTTDRPGVRVPAAFPSTAGASEGDSNLGPHRRAWTAAITDEAGRALLEEDARLFLHQSLSTPCLAAIRKADGSWIEDNAGRGHMDFHGNNAHHSGTKSV